jgi:hypothetical protein
MTSPPLTGGTSSLSRSGENTKSQNTELGCLNAVTTAHASDEFAPESGYPDADSVDAS